MPEELSVRKLWLERLLLGPQLQLYLAGLAIVLEAPELILLSDDLDEPRRRVTGFFTETELRTILATGLSSLSDERFTALMRAPQIILDLQEEVLISGGPYWDA